MESIQSIISTEEITGILIYFPLINKFLKEIIDELQDFLDLFENSAKSIKLEENNKIQLKIVYNFIFII